MDGNDEAARRERRNALAIQFRKEVSTWSAEKLRRAYAQPEAVAAAERYGTRAEALKAGRETAQRDGLNVVIHSHDDRVRERSNYRKRPSRLPEG